ncbi:ABC transporter substrate-binding protein [Halovenus rubra]|uniref:ABC transporter substrate-binding protein n=2 Tax=Halovenus rubra TaxID=869890 RepID=A0ABD5XAK2_9EURY|nr:ABC transporter substrate-binding protein [Halovenus rubra]
MSPDIERRQFLTAVGTVATAAMAGCSSDDNDPVEDDSSTGEDSTGNDNSDTTGDSDGDGGSDGGQVNLVQIPQETTDPIGIAGPVNAWTNWQVHEQLFTYEDGTPPVVSSLAKEYTVSDDYLTYTFELREGVMFHNGDELTAEDVVYSWRRLAESENNRGHADRIVRGPMSVDHDVNDDDETVPDSLALEAVDDYTVEMTLETPFHGTLGNLADPRLSVIPEGVVGDIEGYDGEYEYDEWVSQHLHGTGPFQLDSWNRGSEISLSRYDDYHGSVANVEGVTVQILGDPNAVFTSAVNEQNVDIFELPRSQFNPNLLSVDEDLGGDRREGSYGPVTNDETLNYGETSLPRTQYAIFNTQRVEKPARKAIAYLINQETITETAVRGQGTPAYLLTPPSGFPGGPEAYNELAQNEYPYGYAESDIESARQIMEDAGYSEDNMYETTVQHPSDRQASEWTEIASLLQSQAEAAHIDISIEEAPSSTLTNRAFEGEITIYLVWNALNWLEADAMLRFAYPNQYAWSRWGAEVDFEYEGLSEAAKQATDAWDQYEQHQTPSESDQEMRNESYLDIERANWDDMTMLPLWHPIEELYWYDWVEGFEMHGPQRRPALNNVSFNR